MDLRPILSDPHPIWTECRDNIGIDHVSVFDTLTSFNDNTTFVQITTAENLKSK